jgi:MoxR-like ATPase
MAYAKLFDPSLPAPLTLERSAGRLGDKPPEEGYVYDDADDRIVLAVNVALATGRPLLIAGEAGTGKSSLAVDVANRLG